MINWTGVFNIVYRKGLEKKIKAGMVAAIPFGNAGRVRKGYVIGLSDKPKIAPEKIKEICIICREKITGFIGRW